MAPEYPSVPLFKEATPRMDARSIVLLAANEPPQQRIRSRNRGDCLRPLMTMFLTIALAFTGIGVTPADAQFRESFEAPEPSWELADRDCTVRVTRHERTFDQAHSGRASEYVQLQSGVGTYIHLTHAVPPSRMIEELRPSVWLKADQSGLQFMVRVVLPHTKDPDTGGPIKTLLRGSAYKQAGTWEQLTVPECSRTLARQLPLLRSQFGPEVTLREAYIDMMVINVYGVAGRADFWIDDLEVDGQVDATTVYEHAAVAYEQPAAVEGGDDQRMGGPALPRTGRSRSLWDGRPEMVRMIEYRGEPVDWLKSLGFNAISLPTPPSPELLAQVEQHGLWMVAPPPVSHSTSGYGTAASRLLAWSLGYDLIPGSLETTRRLAGQLDRTAGDLCPPLVCGADARIWEYSRVADILLLAAPGPNGTLPLADFGQWYLQRAALIQLGTAFWATVPTQVSPRATAQMRGLGANLPVPLALEPEQIRLMSYHAIASGARGIYFRSSSRLDQNDSATRLRALTLQWLNQEMAILEPWVATGSHDSEVDTGDSSVRVSILKTDRSRLLLAIRRAANQQYVTGPVDARSVSFEVFGVPETDEAYRIAPDGLHRVRQHRGAGLRVTLDDSRSVSAMVLTQDRLVINYLARQIEDSRKQRSKLVAEMAAQWYAAVTATHEQLYGAIPVAGPSSHAMEQARHELQHFEQLLEDGGHDRALEFYLRGLDQLAAARYYEWTTATRSFLSPVSTPLCVSYFSLPFHYALTQQMQGTSWGANSLAGGDFESLPHMQSNGWQHIQDDQPDVTSSVELSLHAPRSGRSALRMQCWPRNAADAPLVLDHPPVTIRSGEVPVQPGQILRVHGWARVPQTIVASQDGLLVYDSAGGKELALRLTQAEDWQEFTLFRVAPRQGTISLTFALAGFGEAWLDGVTISPLLHSAANVSETPNETTVR